MKKILIFWTLLASFHLKADYVCFLMMNTEIKHTIEENDRQKTMQKDQLGNLGTETVNNQQWNSFKKITTKINSRLNAVSFALQAAPTGVVITRTIQEIYQLQKAIYDELADAPMFIVTAMPAEFRFVEDLEMDVRLIAGIILSYGAINQMEKAERKILLDYAKEEIYQLKLQSFTTLNNIRMAKKTYEMQKHLIKYLINRDKQIVTDIIINAKNL